MKQGRIGEICAAIIDYRGKTPPKSGEGVKLLTAKVIKGGAIDEARLEYISTETYSWWMRRGFPRRWDILLTTEAPLGETAFLRTTEPVALAQRVILLRGNPRVVDQTYLFAALRSPLVQARLRQRSSGTTVLGIKQSELRKVEIPLPPIQTQRKIAAILSAYDDLIENNTRRIKILEEVAQAIYREWFVEFRYPGHEGVPLVDSEIGPIPEGWSIRELSTIATVVMGQSPRSEFYNSKGAGLPFHQGVGSYGRHFPNHVTFSTEGDRRALDGDILVSVRAPVGRINLADRELILGRGLCSVRPRLGHRQFVLSQLRKLFEIEDSMGSGAIYNAVKRSDVEGLRVLWPPSDLISRYEAVADPLLGLLRAVTAITETLRETRDLLLPRLISGEIDVSDLRVNTAGLVA